MAITTNNLISRQTVGSAGAASITFSNIPQTFTDLRLVSSLRGDANTVDMTYTFNGLTSNQSQKLLRGNGTAAASGTDTLIYGLQNASTYTASVFSNQEIYIPNYTSANYKSMSLDGVTENNATTSYTYLEAQLWSATAAITSIGLVAGGSGSFTQYSTFSLYGISSNTSTQNTSVPSATGGDVITTDGTYWYHAFKYSGTFTPLKALTADCLVIGAGGAGGPNGRGGGAGGELFYSSGVSMGTSSFTCTIGAGAAWSSNNGRNGSSSVLSGSSFTTITATAGQDSGDPNGGVGRNSGASGGNYGTTGTNGGTGISTYSSWGSATSTGQNVSGTYYYVGGGGGGANTASNSTGGSGGGGRGGAVFASPLPATAGTANTGGGGGGMGNGETTTNTNGGSGIIIVRYAV